MSDTLVEKAAALLKKLEEVETKVTQRSADLFMKCHHLLDAAAGVFASWSGSFFGYHTELYYRNFERPPLGEHFSPEWGGVMGLPLGWASRSPDEVKKRIEEIANSSFDAIDADTANVRDEVKDFQSEIVVNLSPLRQVLGFEKEKTLFDEVENFEFEKSAGTYINANIPKTFISRDSTAVAQGIRVPAHLYYEGLAQEYRSRCGAAQDFVKLAKRFLRQLQVQMSGIGIAAGPPLRDVIDIVTQVLKRFHLVSKQLRHRREGRHTLEIHDEYDVQDLLHGLLRLHFDDVRPEEWTPSYAGGAARMDFLLKAEQIVVEAKMTRKNHGAREVSGSVQAQELKKRERRSVEPSHETTERVFAA